MSLDLLERIMTHYNNKYSTDFSHGSMENEFEIYEPYHSQNASHHQPFEIFQPLPAYSTILGVCEDGLPLVLDLNDPNPGAILISGALHTGKSRLLKSIINSACMTNTATQLYFYIITPEPGNHFDLRTQEHCYGIYSSYDKLACELIVDLAALVEQRKGGRHLGLKCILAIENLYEFVKHQDFDVLNHLKWLYRFGANNGIWLISTLETERTNLIESELINEQKTHILSGSNNLRLNETTSNPASLGNPGSYRTQVGTQWLDFWLPSNS